MIKQIRGITLIALVITIIVLLILASIGINLTIGENGLITRAQEATEEYEQSQLAEEIQLEINNIQLRKIEEGKEITRQDLFELKNIDVVIELVDIPTYVEYKDYAFEIDENYKVLPAGKLSGAKPEVTITEIDINEFEVKVQVTATIAEGEIESIEPLNGAELETENSSSDKIFILTKNQEYIFKTTGKNKRISIDRINVDKILITGEDSLLSAISKITTSGEQEVGVIGEDSKGKKKVDYSLNVIVHKGDVLLNGENEVEGSTLDEVNKIYAFGSKDDVATGSSKEQYAKNTVVLKVEGNLTVEEGVTLTSVQSSSGFGGPKGMIVYCTGTLTNNGIISMTERGGWAPGQDVYLWKNKEAGTDNNGIGGRYEYIPTYGSQGAISHSTTVVSTYQYVNSNDAGAQAVGRKTAGGASGGAGKIGIDVKGTGGNGRTRNIL